MGTTQRLGHDAGVVPERCAGTDMAGKLLHHGFIDACHGEVAHECPPKIVEGAPFDAATLHYLTEASVNVIPHWLSIPSVKHKLTFARQGPQFEFRTLGCTCSQLYQGFDGFLRTCGFAQGGINLSRSDSRCRVRSISRKVIAQTELEIRERLLGLARKLAQQIHGCASVLHGEGTAQAKVWSEGMKGCLCEQGPEAVLEKLRGYITRNRQRLCYPQFRQQGLPVGSGWVESDCKQVIRKRLKGSGMRWSIKGTQEILAVRCVALSDLWEDAWTKCA